MFDSKAFGHVLVLDGEREPVLTLDLPDATPSASALKPPPLAPAGVIQCTQRDEFSYQEMIANLPLCALAVSGYQAMWLPDREDSASSPGMFTTPFVTSCLVWHLHRRIQSLRFPHPTLLSTCYIVWQPCPLLVLTQASPQIDCLCSCALAGRAQEGACGGGRGRRCA